MGIELVDAHVLLSLVLIAVTGLLLYFSCSRGVPFWARKERKTAVAFRYSNAVTVGVDHELANLLVSSDSHVASGQVGMHVPSVGDIVTNSSEAISGSKMLWYKGVSGSR